MPVLKFLNAFVFTLLWLCLGCVIAADPAVYLTLHRRNDRFATHDAANLTHIAIVLSEVELRYSKTQRVVEGNRLGHRWKSHHIGTTLDEQLVNAVGHAGIWFHPLPMSNMLQNIEIDISLISPDFYISTTTSGQGSQYNSFVSTHIPSGEHVHPLCKKPTDLFYLSFAPGRPAQPINLSFPLCTPSHSHSLTLSHSGALLGLSPPNSQLSQLSSLPFLIQLYSLGLITRKVFSLTLFTATTGLLTLGSTPAELIARARLTTEVELANFGNPLYTPSYISALVSEQLPAILPPTLEDQYHWLRTSGPRGLWTTLLSGVWIDGSKVLQNQPVLLDVNCPFILAPPLATRRFYESIGGAQWIPAKSANRSEGEGEDPPHYPRPQRSDERASRVKRSGFWKIPCLNRVGVAWEFRGKMFAAFKEGGREQALFGPAGGAMSLGKFVAEGNNDNNDDNEDRTEAGTGYCVGIVVETEMGLGGKGREAWKNSGLRDVWVLGEPFFRGLDVVFDVETEGKERIGLRG